MAGIAELEPGSVDCLWTSPPYKRKDGYSDALMSAMAQGAFRAARSGALFFVNFGCLKSEKDNLRVERMREAIRDAGWTWTGWPMTVIWWKCGHFTPLPGFNLNGLWEWMFIFFKDSPPTLNRKLVPYVDRGNAKRYGGGSDLRCPGNVWPVRYETVQRSEQKGHKDRAPAELVERSLRLAGLRAGSLVCDPFAGGGTTGRVAEQLGLRFIGFDVTAKPETD